MHRIALVGITETDLADIVNVALPEQTSVETRSRQGGIYLDLATAAIVVPAIASVASAAISAIAAVWAAKVSARAAEKANAPTVGAGPPAIEIETLAGSVVVPIQKDFEVNLGRALPESVRSILTIRFLDRAPRGGW